MIFIFYCCLSSPEYKYWSQVVSALEKCFTFELDDSIFPCSLQQANYLHYYCLSFHLFTFFFSLTYISGYFTVDTENIFKQDTGNVLLLVKVVRHGGVVPDDLTHVHHLHTDILVSSSPSDSSQSTFLKISL